jgi:catechol 2,3-dioxygenase-like lactoylglutathione lyase family enzyme
MAKLRHLALATNDPDATAAFYEDAFEFTRVRSTKGKWGYGHILTDGVINLAVLRFTTDEAAGVEKGASYAGLHHIGFEVDDIDVAAKRVEAAGGITREDISDALGIPHDGSVRGEFKYEGPNGVVFDLGEPGFWQLSSPTR